MSNSLLVGIDVSLNDNKVRILHPDGTSLSRQTPKTPHKRALALTARKFVRLVYALLHDNRLYIPPKGE